MVYSKTFWQDVRQAYELGGEPVTALAKRFGIARNTLLNRARNEDWRPRRTRRPQGERGRDGTIRRLYRTIDLKLAQLEARMQNDNDLNAADHERETRAIGQLIRNFEKVCDLENGARDGSRQKQDSKPDLKAELGELDPHSLREELAQRIIQLCEKQPDSS